MTDIAPNKRKFLSFLTKSFCLLWLISCSDAIKYNSVDVNTEIQMLGMAPPINFQTTEEASKDHIFLSWGYPHGIIVSFHLYRSTREGGPFTLIHSDFSEKFYYDTSALPGVRYFYKVRASSVLYGTSDFTETKAGMRAGRGPDSQPNDTQETAMEIKVGLLYEEALYPANDHDWYKIKCQRGEFKLFSILDSDNPSSIKLFNIRISNSNGKELFLGEKLKINTAIRLVIREEAEWLYLEITPPKGSYSVTGDYDLLVSDFSKFDLFPLQKINSNYSSYIKLEWDPFPLAQIAQKYRIERRNGDSPWETISVSSFPPSAITAQSLLPADITTAYDCTALPGQLYEYRVAGIVEEAADKTPEIAAYSTSSTGVRKAVPAGSSQNISFASASSLSPNGPEKTGNICETGISNYYKTNLTTDRNYTLTVTPSADNQILFQLSVYDSDRSRLILSPVTEKEKSVMHLRVPRNGDYYIEVDGCNTTGTYSIKIESS